MYANSKLCLESLREKLLLSTSIPGWRGSLKQPRPFKTPTHRRPWALKLLLLSVNDMTVFMFCSSVNVTRVSHPGQTWRCCTFHPLTLHVHFSHVKTSHCDQWCISCLASFSSTAPHTHTHRHTPTQLIMVSFGPIYSMLTLWTRGINHFHFHSKSV